MRANLSVVAYLEGEKPDFVTSVIFAVLNAAMVPIVYCTPRFGSFFGTVLKADIL